MPLFNVTVREHACTGRSYTEVVQAESWKRRCNWPPSGPPRPGRCLILSRSQTPPTARGVPMPGSTRRRTAGWRRDTIRRTSPVPPEYWRPVRWVRDDRGLAYPITGGSHQPAMIPPVHASAARSGAPQGPLRPIDLYGETVPARRASSCPAPGSHTRLPGFAWADGGQAGQVSSKDRLVSKSLSRGPGSPCRRGHWRAR